MLKIFIGESDKTDVRPLYEIIVQEARKRGMAGVTVLQGFMGFGSKRRIHTSKVFGLSEDLPVVIEIVDAENRIETLLATLEQMIGERLITLEIGRVKVYRQDAAENN